MPRKSPTIRQQINRFTEQVDATQRTVALALSLYTLREKLNSDGRSPSKTLEKMINSTVEAGLQQGEKLVEAWTKHDRLRG
jgi:hypothetical protein